MSKSLETQETPLPINSDEMERICKHVSCSDFSEICYRLSYSESIQVYHELQSRAQRISYQLTSRFSPELSWKVKAESALSIIKDKIGIVSQRIDTIRNNSISTLLDSIGGAGQLDSCRLSLIKCLLHIIDTRCQLSRFTADERAVVDAARKVAGVSPEEKFESFSYNPVLKSVVSDDYNAEIAKITLNSFMSDEHGFLFASSSEMKSLLLRVEPLVNYTKMKSECVQEKHDESRCAHCRSIQIHEDILELINKLK